MTSTRLHDTIALATLALVATLLFADVVVGTQNFYMRDLTRYYYPTKQVLREIVQQGEIPFWNRRFAGGQPLAANPEHEVFYPLTWLILLPSYDLGYRLHILVHVYIGMFGMYALLRSMRLRAAAAAFGAAAFALGGTYLSYINLLPILFCAAWIPLTCLYVRKFLLQPCVRYFALAALLFGLQMLVGEPTTIMQTGFLMGMYALYRGWYAIRDAELPARLAIPEMLSRVAFIGLICVAALAVGAVQILPALDHVSDSSRSRPFDFSLVSAWSMPWAKVAELIYPNFLGHISIDRVMWYWGGGLYPGMGSPFLFSIYPGLLVTALVAAALFVRPRGGRFVLILSAFSVLVAAGSHTPLLQFLYDRGIATSIRYPEKFLLIAIFAMIVLASQLFQQLLDGDGPLREAAMGFIAATALIASALAIASFTTEYSSTFTRIWGVKGANLGQWISLSRTGWMIALLRGAFLFGILSILPILRRPLALALLSLFVAADLGPVVHQLNPRMPAEFLTTAPETISLLRGDRSSYRIFHEADWYGQEETARSYFSTGDAVYWIVRGGLFPMTPAGHGFSMVMERDYDKTALLPTIDFVQSVWDVKRSGREDWWKPFAAMSNVRYRAVYKPFSKEKARVKGDLRRMVAVEFHDVGNHQRYYFADQIVPIRDRHEFVDRLSEGTYSDRTAFAGIPAFTPARGIVHRAVETPNTARIDVESFGRAFLVMSVTPHKYWRVSIDGKPVRPVTTNIGYQGVTVPAGRHVVTMRYRNDLVVRGAAATSAAVLLLGCAVLVPRRRNAR